LEADEDGHRGEDERVDVEGDGAEAKRTADEEGADDEPDEEEGETGLKEKPARREEQHETQVAPAIAPRAKVRRAAASVGAKRRRDFGDTQTEERGLDDHFGGELHAGGAEFEAIVGVAGKSAKAAMEIADGTTEEEATDAGEDGVAEVAVFPRHGAGLDAAEEAVAHDEVVAFAEFLYEAAGVGEVVGAVGVAHEDEAATGGGDAALEGAAVSFLGYADDAGAEARGDLLGTVGGAVVGDDHFAGEVLLAERAQGFFDAAGEGFGLVEARHDDGQLKGSVGGGRFHEGASEADGSSTRKQMKDDAKQEEHEANGGEGEVVLQEFFGEPGEAAEFDGLGDGEPGVGVGVVGGDPPRTGGTEDRDVFPAFAGDGIGNDGDFGRAGLDGEREAGVGTAEIAGDAKAKEGERGVGLGGALPGERFGGGERIGADGNGER